MATSKLVKPHTPHPTPHTLPPGKTFSANPNYQDFLAIVQKGKV
ncbi:MAG: hypothetical protein PX481_16260 [Microcystis sp. M53603_WE2]|nr:MULTISPECIES: hypothetical protein [unclassified Microcystis]MDJ0530238.1 hypothetical protein [Microcystis sp. M53600_WE12]MDJ0540203.1 hypothetical protein [Microcystis sp. M53603_WE2]MDJ0565137.1 hypothetical protein [Microcystis sp. M49629_WE12]MDJ0604090.1 hypothetical protein [Microcystis sp. M53602_WE12]